MDKQYIKMLQQFWYILIVFIRMRTAEAQSRAVWAPRTQSDSRALTNWTTGTADF